MRANRIGAVILIFLAATAAWFMLGRTIVERTRASYANLDPRVQGLWGNQVAQISPVVTAGTDFIDLRSSKVKADIQLDYRRKGFLWFPVYFVNFNGIYSIKNTFPTARDFTISVPFPTDKGNLDTFAFSVNGDGEWKTWGSQATNSIRLAPGQQANIEVAYSTRGLRTWVYSFDQRVQHVRDFSLRTTTNFDNVDFPTNTVSPTRKQGRDFTWEFSNRLSGFQIGISAPEKLNPGEVAARIAFYAPLGLLFFFTIVLATCVVGKVNLHPMHFAFMAAGFFAFHLLFTYMVDHTTISVAFLTSAGVSLALITNYMRLVVGVRFAFLPIGLAQVVYLILFSYAFFFKGYTGLTIAVGSVLTLGVLMQVTAKVDWEHALTGNRPSLRFGDRSAKMPNDGEVAE